MRSNVSEPFQYFTFTHLISSAASSNITRTCAFDYNKDLLLPQSNILFLYLISHYYYFILLLAREGIVSRDSC